MVVMNPAAMKAAFILSFRKKLEGNVFILNE